MNNEMPSSAFNRVNGGGGSSSLWTPSSAPSVHTPFILAPPPAGTASSAGTHGSNNNNNSTTNGTSTGSPMKVPVKPPPLKSLPPLSGYGGGSSVPLSPSGLANMADRLPHLTLPFSPDMLWRYPTQFSALTASSPVSAANQHSHHSHHPHQQQPPSSPHLDVKTHLPGALGPDPRTWAREDVVTFLRWCEREFDLPGLDLDKFQMNGKALCLLNKADIAERAPGSGDVVHNALQLLLRDAPYTGRVPSSPLTPHPHTAHQQHLLSHALAAAAAHQQQQLNNSSSGSSSGSGNGGGSHLLSPPNSARTPTSASWPSAAGPLFASADFHSLGHLIQQTNSVTLSPAPSVSDGSGNSQGGSPSHAEQSAAAAAAAAALAAQAHINFYTQALAQAHNQAQAVAASNAQHHAGGGAGSNSGSQSDSEENDSAQDSPSRSPAPSTPIHLAPPPMSPLATTFSIKLEKDSLSTTPSSDRNGGSASNGGGDGLDSGSNGRLLWDFLQQLLNDPSQRYSHYIAWKNRETGVFKITDPAGLARLWGIQKNHPSMNYDKMSRALRYYYRVNILRKVQGERHCYQFLRNPIELKSIKNISLLRHQMAAAAAAAATTTTSSSSSTSSTTSTATLGSSGKMADSTDASSERYSPSSSCNAIPDQDYGLHNNNNNNNNNNIEQQETEDCDMPTDLSMDNCERRGHTNPTSSSATNSYLPPPIKTENMAS